MPLGQLLWYGHSNHSEIMQSLYPDTFCVQIDGVIAEYPVCQSYSMLGKQQAMQLTFQGVSKQSGISSQF